MKILVYGAGVLGSLLAVQLHEAGHDVELLARGERLAALRRHGVQVADGNSPVVRAIPVPVVEWPGDGYDLIAVLVRTHQVDAVLESVADVRGDVLLLLNWAGGAVDTSGRVLLGFPAQGGTMDGDVVRRRVPGPLIRRIPMLIGEADGRTTPRVERIVGVLRTAGIAAKAEPRMDAWLATHAAFEVPLGRAVHAAGGPEALARDPAAVRAMLHQLRRQLADLPTPIVPRGFAALRTLPEWLLVPVLRRFLRSSVAVQSGLSNTSPAVTGEYDRLAQQLRDRS